MSNNKYSHDNLIDFADISYASFKEGDYFNKGLTIGSLISDDVVNTNNDGDNNNEDNKDEDIFIEGEVYNKEYMKANFLKYSDYEILKVQSNGEGFYGVALKSPEEDIIVSMRGSAQPIDWDHNIFETPDKYITSQGQEAAAFLEDVLLKTKGEVYVVGHSLGGYLAQYAALENYKYNR